MTMIELVAALALFIVILGTLLTLLNSATSLWSTSRSQQREHAVGQHILDLLADDLQHAVTDSGTPTNSLAEVPATFILDTRTNMPPNGVQIVLQFARRSAQHARTSAPPGTPLSLDAIYYTYARNTLFRHAIPLSYATFAEAEPLGKLLDDYRSSVDKPELHDQILAYVTAPDTHAAPSGADWSYSVLAERVDLLDLPALLPEAFARTPASVKRVTDPLPATALPQPPAYEYLETDVLPDQIDVALRLLSEGDWDTLQRLEHDTSEDAALRKAGLGLLFSKRITFPAQGGSRLP